MQLLLCRRPVGPVEVRGGEVVNTRLDKFQSGPDAGLVQLANREGHGVRHQLLNDRTGVETAPAETLSDEAEMSQPYAEFSGGVSQQQRCGPSGGGVRSGGCGGTGPQRV